MTIIVLLNTFSLYFCA